MIMLNMQCAVLGALIGRSFGGQREALIGALVGILVSCIINIILYETL